MSAQIDTLNKLVTENGFDSIGELFCTVFDGQEKLASLVAAGGEKSSEANELRGRLENLEPIAAFAKKNKLDWKVLIQELKDKLIDEDFETIEACSENIQSATEQLAKLEKQGQGSGKTKKSQLCDQLRRWQLIIRMHNHVERLMHLESSEKAATTLEVQNGEGADKIFAEIEEMLRDEDLASIGDCIEAIAKKESELQDLNGRNLSGSKKAITIRSELERFQLIVEKYNEMKCMQPIAEPEDSAVDQVLIRKLSSELQHLLADEDLESVEECATKIAAANSKLQDLISRNCGDTKAANSQRTLLESLNVIMAKHQELLDASIPHDRTIVTTISASPLSIETSPEFRRLEELRKKLLDLLTDEDFESILDCQNTIKAKEVALKSLVSKGSGDTKAARLVREDLERMDSIIAIHKEILQLEPVERVEHNEGFSEPVVEESLIVDVSQIQTASRLSVRRPKLLRDDSAKAIQTREDDRLIIEKLTKTLTSVPECAEKTVLQLYLFFKNQNEILETNDTHSAASNASDSVTFLVSENLVAMVSQLKLQLKEEELFDTFVFDLIRRLENSMSNSDILNLNELANECWKLWKHLQPLDVALMLDLLMDTDKSAQRIRGKDIVLLLGGSGAGKSTTIHWLARSVMEKIYVDDLPHIAPVSIKQEELNAVTTSPFPRSETRCIYDVTIQGAKGEPVVVCDTPGFGDTEGPEIDISNGMGVVRAVKLCHSVKPLVLVSKNNIGDRLEGLLKLSHILLMFIPHIDKHLTGFSYAFTKYSKDESDEIHHKLRHYFRKPPASEVGNAGFLALLGDMVAKTEIEAQIINLLKDKPDQFLTLLSTTQRIENPMDVFCYFVASDSWEKLKDQLNKHQFSVQKALRRMDIPLVRYKLDQISLMENNLEFAECETAYSACVQECYRLIEELLTTVNVRLESAMSDSNFSVDDDITQVITAMMKLCALEPVRANHCMDQPHLIELCETKLGKVQLTLLDGVRAYCVQSMALVCVSVDDSIQQQPNYYSSPWKATCPPLDVVVNRLNKMKCICASTDNNEFTLLHEELNTIYETACNHMLDIVTKSHSISLNAMTDGSFSVLLCELNRLSLLRQLLVGHCMISTADLNNAYDSIILGMGAIWKTQYETADHYIHNEVMLADEVHFVFTALQSFQAVSQSEGLMKHVDLAIPSDYRQHLLLSITDVYVKQLTDRICQECENGSSFPDLRRLVERMDNVRILPEIKHNCGTLCNTAIEAIRRRINECREYLKLSLVKIVNNVEEISQFNVDQFQSKFEDLSEALCFAHHESGVFTNEFGDVCIAVIEYHNSLLNVLKNNPIGIAETSKLMDRFKYAQSIDLLSCCHSIITQSKLLAQSIHDSFEENCTSLINTCSEYFVLKNVPLEDIKAGMLFLRLIKQLELKSISFGISKLEMLIESFCEEYFTNLQMMWERGFKVFSDVEAFHTAEDTIAAAESMRCASCDLRMLTKDYEPINNTSLREITTIEGRKIDFYSEFFCDRPKIMQSEWYEVCIPTLASDLRNIIILPSDKLDDAILFQKLQVAQALKRLDAYASSNLTERTSFAEMAVSIESLIAANNKSKVSSIIMAVRTKKYDEFVALRTAFSTSIEEDARDVDSIVRELGESIRSSIRSLENDVKAAKFEDLHSFTEFVKRLAQVHTDCCTVQPYLEEPLKTDWELHLHSVENSLFLWISIKKLNRVDSVLLTRDFYKCEKSLSECSELASVIESVFSERKEQPKLSDLQEAIVQKRKEVRIKAQESVQFYGQMSLKMYLSDPPIDFFNKLELVSDDPFYIECSDELSQLIVQSVIKLLDSMRELDFNEALLGVAEIDSCAKYLPPKIHGMYEDKLHTFKNDLQAAIEAYQREIEEDAKLGRLTNLVETLVKNYNCGQYSNVTRCKTSIKALMMATFTRFQSDLSKGNLSTVLENFPEHWINWHFYTTQLSSLSIHSRYVNLREDPECVTLCIDMKKLIRAELVKVIAEVDASDLRSVEKKLDHLLVFLDFKQTDLARNYSECLYNALVSKHPEIETKLKEAIMRIVGLLHKLAEEFQDKLKSENVLEIRQLLELTQDLSTMFARLEAFSKTSYGPKELPGLLAMLKTCLHYKDMRFKLSEYTTACASNIDEPLLKNPKTGTENALDRDAYYTNLYSSYTNFKRLKQLSLNMDADGSFGNKEEELLNKKIEQRLNDVYNHLIFLLNKWPTDDNEVYSQFQIWNDNLRSFVVNFTDPTLNAFAAGLKDKTRDQVRAKIVAIMIPLKPSSDLNDVMGLLIKVKSIVLAIPAFKNDIDKLLNEFLKNFKDAPGGVQKIGLLGVELNKQKTDVSQRIINDHPTFEGYALSLRNEKTSKFTAEHVLKALRENAGGRIAPINAAKIAELLKMHQEFDTEYWGLVQDGLADRTAKQTMIVKSASQLATNIKSSTTKQVRSDLLRRLIAHIFAWWTLAHAKHYVEAAAASESESSKAPLTKDTTLASVSPLSGKSPSAKAASSTDIASQDASMKNYLMQPHAAQVISIFRLLGVDSDSNNDPKTGMSNHLIQVGTGEGKSVILAVTSIALAMMGYEVYCGCYSQYLSERDCEAFQNVFHAFAVDSYISYGTFNKLCENYINKNGEVRDLVKAAFHGRAIGDVAKPTSARGKILLIDEVDVFFDKEFYGNVYKSLAKITDPSIKALIDHIWNNRGSAPALRYDTLKTHQVFQNVLKAFPGWSDLLHESLKSMLMDIKSFESQDYVVLNGRIGYKDQDGISFNTFYGYKTLFAHYKECGLKSVTPSTLQEKIALYIDCGNFSYAEIPKEYVHVMGVSGTLESLSDPKKQLLVNAYNIRKGTYTPSVYGPNKVEFVRETTDVRVEPDASYHSAIRNQIDERMRSIVNPSASEARAVLVFFETKKKLLEFYNCPAFSHRKQKARIMTEDVLPANREDLIRQAVTAGSVTLLTSEFGRGTDFICFDDHLLTAGGVHVIQTFVSDEVSEETQIMGRTARQGNRGSFSMVILDQYLEKYGIQAQQVTQMNNTGTKYSTIDRHRTDFYNNQYPKDTAYVADIKADHVKSTKFVASLLSENIKEVKAFLLESNQSYWVQESSGVCRTVVLMDGTYSMSGTITAAKQKVKNMFENAYAVLTKENHSGSFEIQFAVYRNYSCTRNLLLQFSSWGAKPDDLRAFIDSISVDGGLGNEAIEIGFWHVNNEIAKGKVSQVILIGDMPPNTRSEVSQKRNDNMGGETYWSTTEFKNPTYYEDEMKNLIEKNIPVHTFHIGGSARSVFGEIAEATGGTLSELDVKSSNDNLTHLITETVLKSVGGATDGARLVNAYKAMFGGSGRGFV